jgi:hypothetical protein
MNSLEAMITDCRKKLRRDGHDGSGINVCGTWRETTEHQRNDLVACNGGSFIALKDAPGPCPGAGMAACLPLVIPAAD